MKYSNRIMNKVCVLIESLIRQHVGYNLCVSGDGKKRSYTWLHVYSHNQTTAQKQTQEPLKWGQLEWGGSSHSALRSPATRRSQHGEKGFLKQSQNEVHAYTRMYVCVSVCGHTYACAAKLPPFKMNAEVLISWASRHRLEVFGDSWSGTGITRTT